MPIKTSRVRRGIALSAVLAVAGGAAAFAPAAIKTSHNAKPPAPLRCCDRKI